MFSVAHVTWLPGLPERLATHFDAAGKANGWMTRSQHGAFMLLFGLGVPALFLILCWSLLYFSPSMVNLPIVWLLLKFKRTTAPPMSL